MIAKKQRKSNKIVKRIKSKCLKHYLDTTRRQIDSIKNTISRWVNSDKTITEGGKIPPVCTQTVFSPSRPPLGEARFFGNSLNRHVKNKRENKLQVTIVCVSLQCDFLGTTDMRHVLFCTRAN